MFRDEIYARLVQDLMGPAHETEELSDRPSQRYSTGILYPAESAFLPEEDVDGGGAANGQEDPGASSDDTPNSLIGSYKPSAAGMSFAVVLHKESNDASIDVKVSCAEYERHESTAGTDGSKAKKQVRWRRVPLFASLIIKLAPGEQRVDLSPLGIRAMELYCVTLRRGSLLTVTMAITNRRARGESRDYDEAQHLFQTCLSVSSPGGCELAPRPTVRTPIDEDDRVSALIYRNEKEYVVGHTCSARAQIRDGIAQSLSTEWIPYFTVKSVSDKGDKAFSPISGKSDTDPLCADWLAHCSDQYLTSSLQKILSCYEAWIVDQLDAVPALPEQLREQGLQNLSRCREGAERMRSSILLIEKDERVRRAFRLAQEAMDLQFRWARNGEKLFWRPFQIGFQLLSITGIVNRGHKDRETLDLLWFPTGGGKTEAYLALVAFATIYRRLNDGKVGGGVVAIMRYTLRLLTIQQFQRAAALILACEMLRARHLAMNDSSLGNQPFGIGLWVGEAATPGTLKAAVESSPTDPSQPRQLTDCPCCGSTLIWDIKLKGSIVRCVNLKSCELAKEVEQFPVWTIDEEVYKYTPSLIIGTIDKFAQIVRNVDTGVLFGLGKDFLPPDLIIQDELHLISGPLGTVSGLYEIAVDELCSRMGWRPKILGSTATIRRASDQAKALFDRNTYQFPAPGLNANNSGFAIEDMSAPGRLYIGVSTAGRSATYMLQAISASLLQSSTSPVAAPEERDFYWSLVIYFNSLRELGRALVLVQDDVPVTIRQLAARRAEPARSLSAPAELTSRVRSYEIRDMLNQLRRIAGDPEAVDMLLASNMISVGMDIPRLGVMLVNAQPKTLSEYIQATSRVGRGKVPGVVVTMYNSTRARDRSRYETFETWHRSLYRDVEATSVTPFASRAQDKALHAVLVALSRHLVKGLEKGPMLNAALKVDVEKIAAVIERRSASVDQSEQASVSRKLKTLIEQWASKSDLEVFWDDYGKRSSLMMSAEQYAAKATIDPDLDPISGGSALWPTPNSMREVEPGVPFVLRRVLRAEDQNGK